MATLEDLEKRIEELEKANRSGTERRVLRFTRGLQTQALTGAAAGSPSPSSVARNVDSAGSCKAQCWGFVYNTTSYVHLSILAPDDIYDIDNVTLILHWQPASGYASGTFIWDAEYIVTTETHTMGSGTATNITSGAITPANDTDMIKTTFADTIDLDAGEILHLTILRDITDTTTATAQLRHIEIEYSAWISGKRMHPGMEAG